MEEEAGDKGVEEYCDRVSGCVVRLVSFAKMFFNISSARFQAPVLPAYL